MSAIQASTSAVRSPSQQFENTTVGVVSTTVVDVVSPGGRPAAAGCTFGVADRARFGRVGLSAVEGAQAASSVAVTPRAPLNSRRREMDAWGRPGFDARTVPPVLARIVGVAGPA